MRRSSTRTLLITALLLFGALACHITPSMSMGVGFNYYGGSFHAQPHANVGFYGHP